MNDTILSGIALTFFTSLPLFSLTISCKCPPLQLCNICSSYQGKLWLTQVRHWTTDDGGQQSNLESINRLVVYGILSGSDELCCAASALVYNLTRYQVILIIIILSFYKVLLYTRRASQSASNYYPWSLGLK